MIPKKTAIFSVLAAVILIPSLYGYSSYRQLRVDTRLNAEFERKLYEAVDKKQTFDMKDLTSFDWDKVYLFGPYTSRETVEEKVGEKWTTSQTFVEYLLQDQALELNPLSFDSLNELVFVNEGQVVLDVLVDRSKVDFHPSADPIPKEGSRFSVEDHRITAVGVAGHRGFGHLPG